MSDNLPDEGITSRVPQKTHVPQKRTSRTFVGWIVWLSVAVTLSTLLWNFAFEVDEGNSVIFQVMGEKLISIGKYGPIEPDKSLAYQAMFRLRMTVCLLWVTYLIVWGLAVSYYWKWKLWRWLSKETNPTMFGAYLIYIFGSMWLIPRLPIPDTIEIHLDVWIFTVLTTYPLFVILTIGVLHILEFRTSRFARGVRGTLFTLGYVAAAFTIFMLLFVGAVKLLALFLIR